MSLSAQELRGVVWDSKQHPISYASVQAYDAQDSIYVEECMSNENGAFTISNLDPHKTYFVKVTCLGYKDLVTPASLQTEMNLVLVEDSQVLNEVTVKGKRLFVKQDGNKTIFNLKAIPNIEGMKINDVLKYAPRVTINSNGDIKMNSQTKTLIQQKNVCLVSNLAKNNIF